MWLIFGSLAAGLLVGAAWRSPKFSSLLSPAITATVCIMLFLLGIETGGNDQVMSQAGELGVDALVLCLCIMACCAAGALVWWRFISSDRRRRA